MDPALRLLAGTCLVVAIGWAHFACSGVSPTTRNALVRTALDEARYQCVTSPPSEPRLQAACIALLDATDSGSAKPDASTDVSPSPEPSDAGLNTEPGNAVRSVGDGGT